MMKQVKKLLALVIILNAFNVNAQNTNGKAKKNSRVYWSNCG